MQAGQAGPSVDSTTSPSTGLDIGEPVDFGFDKQTAMVGDVVIPRANPVGRTRPQGQQST